MKQSKITDTSETYQGPERWAPKIQRSTNTRTVNLASPAADILASLLEEATDRQDNAREDGFVE